MQNVETQVDLIRQICEHQPESAVWVTPVWGTDKSSGTEIIKDFAFQYCNAAAEMISGMPGNQLTGKYVLRDRLPDPGMAETIFEQCLQVYQSGKPLEYTYLSTGLDKYLSLHRVKVQDGVLTTARNRTAEYKTNIEKEQQSKLLLSLVENSPYGISLYESIRDKEGAITDFRLRICNKMSAEITALTLDQLYGHTVKELILLRGTPNYFDVCKAVVETGESKFFEHHSKEKDKWMSISMVKFEDGYLLNYIDITENKRLAQQGSQKAAELDAIFNGSLSGVYSAQVIRNEFGKVTDLVFLRANDSFYKTFNVTPDYIIGKSLLSISTNDSQEAFIGYANEVMMTGTPAIQVLQYHNPDRWFEFSMVKLQEDIISVTVNDITAQRQAALKIEEQKNLLDSILKFSPNGLAITQAIRNEAGEMVDASSVLMNDACEKYNGIPNEVMLANSFATLSPELLESALFKEAVGLKPGEAFRTEYQLPQTGKWIELAIAKMDQERFINVFTDITEVKEAQLHLEQLVEELRRSNSNLEDFAYAASHDLKEPIRKIRVFAEQLRTKYADQLDEAGCRTFERLELAASRMNLLIEDLLQYAHVNQGIETLEEVDLNLKVQKALEDLELSIEEKGAIIHVDDLPVVSGNKRQLQQLFQNLIGNAIKYHKPGAAPEVWISAERQKGRDSGLHLPAAQLEASYHVITVRDNGIGFDQKDADRIFHVFTRLHSGSEYKGTGVGLSIVRKVAENHKGLMKVESAPGAGASFRVYLPV
jgi:signal transduction histidine kinase